MINLSFISFLLLYLYSICSERFFSDFLWNFVCFCFWQILFILTFTFAWKIDDVWASVFIIKISLFYSTSDADFRDFTSVLENTLPYHYSQKLYIILKLFFSPKIWIIYSSSIMTEEIPQWANQYWILIKWIGQ